MNIKNLEKSVKSKKGSIIVEAAIVLPIFLLAILSLVLLIKVAGIEESAMRNLSLDCQKRAKEMYVIPIELPLVHKSDCFELDIPFPLMFNRSLKLQERIVYRGFVGRKSDLDGYGFDEMEKSEDADMVYVFPRAGEKYHKANCRVIVIYPVEKILNPGLKKKYSPCKLCKPNELPNGSRIYCFESSGKVYHKSVCTTVDRYVVEISKEEAIEKGYGPCAFCGGS